MRLLPCLFCFFLLMPAAFSQNTPFNPDDLITVQLNNLDRAVLVQLHQAGVPVYGVRGTTARADLDREGLEQLLRQGIDLQVIPRPLQANPGLRAGYPSHGELTADLQAVAAAYPDICRLHNIGNSYMGRALWMMQISDNVDTEEDEPEFRYISSMHGDEPVGMVLCLNLIHLLTDDYGVDPQITGLVDNLDIWIMPLMNPDGYTEGTRYNLQGHDLNRDFPDRVSDPVNTTAGRAVETQHVMNWGFAHSPVLSGNFHTGALVINYPYDSDPDPYTSYSAAPDDDLIIAQSLVYSSLNSPMYNSSSFSQGITNGAAWYLIYGGMQDWNYVWMGCNDVTIECSDYFWPSASQLPGLWDDNRDSMLAYMALCEQGVRGLVTDSATGAPLAATIQVVGIDHEVYTDPDVGDYHRMLLPGTYTLAISCPGYVGRELSGVSVGSGAATRLDVALDPASLWPDQTSVSARDGVLVNFTLAAGSSNSGREYLLLGSFSGSTPGLPLPGGATLPLNWDLFTDWVLAHLGTSSCLGFYGALNGEGSGLATLNSHGPIPLKHVGKTFTFAYLLGGAPGYDFTSNPVDIPIGP